MNKHLRILALAATVAAIGWVGSSVSRAHEDANPKPGQKVIAAKSDTSKEADLHQKSAMHGGQVSMTKEHHFETVFLPNGVTVYAYSKQEAPAMIEEAKGSAKVSYRDGTSKTVALVAGVPAEKEPAVYFCPMHEQVVQSEPGKCKLCGGMKLFKQDRLIGALDLSKARPGDLEMTIQISGLAGAEPEVTFTEKFQGMASADKETHPHSEK